MERDIFWGKIKEGDEKAFRQLYVDYADLLYGYGMKIVQNEDIVSNAIQSLFVYIFDKRESLRAPKFLASYLCVSLRHIIFAELKRSNRWSLNSLEDIDPKEYDFELEADPESMIIQDEVTRERMAILQKRMKDMSSKQREIIYLRYYKDLSIEEIADIMGLKTQTVRNSCTLGLNILRASKISIISAILYISHFLII